MDEGSFSFVSETSQTKQYKRRDFREKKSDRGDWFLVLKKNMTMTWPSVSYIKFLISHKIWAAFSSVYVSECFRRLLWIQRPVKKRKKKKERKLKWFSYVLCFVVLLSVCSLHQSETTEASLTFRRSFSRTRKEPCLALLRKLSTTPLLT